MSEILTNNKYYKDIADTIRQMKGVATTYKPREMAGALREMYSTEVEGVPPLTFPSNGNNLLNYRIDGASGGIGDLVTDTSDENYGKYKIPVVISGKNLFDENSPLNTNKSVDAQNDVFPANSGGNRRTYFYIAKPNTTYTYSCDTSGDRFVLYEFNRIINLDDYTTPNNLYPTKKIIIPPGILLEYTFTTAENTKMVGIYYALNTIPTNIQIEVGNAKTTYEPYIEPTTTNIYLDEPIGANESKSLSDTNVNIPTINGTNILSIDTTVQPSNVYVQAPKTTDFTDKEAIKV